MRVTDLDRLGASLWAMSPPCQPYTTTSNAKRRDLSDPRAESFVALMQQLKDMQQPPSYIVLENVTGKWGAGAVMCGVPCTSSVISQMECLKAVVSGFVSCSACNLN